VLIETFMARSGACARTHDLRWNHTKVSLPASFASQFDVRGPLAVSHVGHSKVSLPASFASQYDVRGPLAVSHVGHSALFPNWRST